MMNQAATAVMDSRGECEQLAHTHEMTVTPEAASQIHDTVI